MNIFVNSSIGDRFKYTQAVSKSVSSIKFSGDRANTFLLEYSPHIAHFAEINAFILSTSENDTRNHPPQSLFASGFGGEYLLACHHYDWGW